MSDHDFDNYLTLLSSLLRLDSKQRSSIAQELRSHLEDRLDELTVQGISRDQATKQALAEFGDAAGLAGQFVALSKSRKRRWLMRLTTFSLAAALLLAAGLTLLWPARNAAPGRAVLVAQAPQKAADQFSPPPAAARAEQADPFAAPPAAPAPERQAAAQRPTENPSAAARIDHALNQPTELDVVEMPLKDVVAFIADRHQIPILLKAKKLEESGVPADSPITKSLRGIRLSSALNIILEELDLTYLVKDEVLQITTFRDAYAATEIRIYDCRDILTMQTVGKEPVAVPAGAPAPQPGLPGSGPPPGGIGYGSHEYRAQQLMTIITTNVDPDTWQGRDPSARGTAAVSEYNGLIVVTQTAQTHKKIEHVLDMLREAAGLEAPQSGKVVR